jgi:hypothetical protein
VSAADGGAWGFRGNNGDGIALFAINCERVLRAVVKPYKTGDGFIIEIPGIDVRAWHNYRIELTDTFAKFYVDGDLVASHKEGIPYDRPMCIWLDRVSRGQDQTTSVDYVELRRTEQPTQAGVEQPPTEPVTASEQLERLGGLRLT